MSIDKPRASKPVTEASRHIGTIKTIAIGSVQLSYCGQNQEHEESGCTEYEKSWGAALLLLESKLGPFVANAGRQYLVGKFLHPVQRCTSGYTWRRHALDLGRREEIVARHAIGDRLVPQLCHGSYRHHLADSVARSEERRVGKECRL